MTSEGTALRTWKSPDTMGSEAEMEIQNFREKAEHYRRIGRPLLMVMGVLTFPMLLIIFGRNLISLEGLTAILVFIGGLAFLVSAIGGSLLFCLETEMYTKIGEIERKIKISKIKSEGTVTCPKCGENIPVATSKRPFVVRCPKCGTGRIIEQ